MEILAVDGKECKPITPANGAAKHEAIDPWTVRGYLIGVYTGKLITRVEFIRRWGLLYEAGC
jgi:hypothetical protein